MTDLNAGNLFVDIGAKTTALDAALKKAKAELDELERSDPLVDVMVDIEDARQIEQDLDKQIDQIKAQPIDVEVNIDKKGDIEGAGRQVEVFQQKIAKVLGVAAGLTAAVALFGGIAKGVKESGQLTGILADETKKAEGQFRTFSAAVPVIGQLGLAISDVGIALGLVEDGARKAALATKSLEIALQLEGGRKAIGRLQQDLDVLIATMGRFDEVGTAAFDQELFDLGLDPHSTTNRRRRRANTRRTSRDRQTASKVRTDSGRDD